MPAKKWENRGNKRLMKDEWDVMFEYWAVEQANVSYLYCLFVHLEACRSCPMPIF